MDLFELNEAFAAQSIAVIKELKIPIEKVIVFLVRFCHGVIIEFYTLIYSFILR